MKELNNIKKTLLPAIKGLPFILISITLSTALALRFVKYSTPIYEATAKVRLDDIGHGFSSSTLYEDFDVFSHTNKIEAEVEVIKSKLLLEQVVEKLNWQVEYFRKGKIRTSEIYEDAPFQIEYTHINPSLVNKKLNLRVLSNDSFQLSYLLYSEHRSINGVFGQFYSNDDVDFAVYKNDEVIEARSNFQFVDNYQVMINSVDHIVQHEIVPHVDVTAVDKDVAVIRISYESEIAQKTAEFANALAEVYIQDYVNSRKSAATKTLNFIDDQLFTISEQLSQSELALEQYKMENRIVNLRQESETDLRKIAQLKIQLSNLEMNEKALDSLYAYVHNKNIDFLELAPNFQSYNDLLSTEMIKRINSLRAEKKDLLLKYTMQDEKVQVIDKKIADIITYIKESISNSRKSIKIKKSEIEKTIRESETVFDDLPTKEKKLVILQREFELNQKMFNFLTEKKTEASIVKAASVSFHRIIEKAYVPIAPKSPKKELIVIVSVFLGLIIGLVISYAKQFIAGRLYARDDIERVSGIPFLGIVKKMGKKEIEDKQESKEDFFNLAMKLKLTTNLQKGDIISIASTLKKEGRSFIANNLARAMSELGYKTLLLDCNLHNPTLHLEYRLDNNFGLAELITTKGKINDSIRKIEDHLHFMPVGVYAGSSAKITSSKAFGEVLKQLKKEFDLIIIDTPATTASIDAIALMKQSNQTLYVYRANYTKSQYLHHADLLKEEYHIPHMKIILNGAHKATSYSGEYTGSRYNYQHKRGLLANLKHYIKYYLK